MEQIVNDWLAAHQVSVANEESDEERSAEEALFLPCAHCGHPHEDPFEVLDLDLIEEMRCESCGKTFSFALVECLRCVHEDVFTWCDRPSNETLGRLTCRSCGCKHGYEDDGIEE